MFDIFFCHKSLLFWEGGNLKLFESVETLPWQSVPGRCVALLWDLVDEEDEPSHYRSWQEVSPLLPLFRYLLGNNFWSFSQDKVKAEILKLTWPVFSQGRKLALKLMKDQRAELRGILPWQTDTDISNVCEAHLSLLPVTHHLLPPLPNLCFPISLIRKVWFYLKSMGRVVNSSMFQSNMQRQSDFFTSL